MTVEGGFRRGPVLKDWHALSGLQQGSIAYTGFGAVASIAIALANPVSPATYATFIFFTVSAILFERIARYQFENTVAARLHDVIPNRSDLHYIGGTSAGLTWFAENRGGAVKVCNTVYRPHYGTWTSTPDSYARYIAQIKDTLNGGVEWHDLIVAGPADQLSEFYAGLDARQRRQYFARHLPETSLPILQVNLITYQDGTGSVCFGWAFQGGSNACVFASRAPAVVNYFMSYFDALKKPSVEIYSPHHPGLPPSTPPPGTNGNSRQPAQMVNQ